MEEFYEENNYEVASIYEFNGVLLLLLSWASLKVLALFIKGEGSSGVKMTLISASRD